MSKSRPFPKLEGGCCCGLIRYRLEDAPLYCYACHCSDCQKETGSVFSCSVTIEFDRVTSIGKAPPQILHITQNAHTRTAATCPKCHNILWDSGTYAPQTLNVHIGTLDLSGLMEPDIHIYVESKVGWLKLPESAKTMKGDYDRTKAWPKSSLLRLNACIERYKVAEKNGEVGLDGKLDDVQKEGVGIGGAKVQPEWKVDGEVDVDGGDDAEDKTPTNGSPEEKESLDGEAEDDEEFDRRQDEIERALQERLEKLTLKLSEQEKAAA